MRPPAAQRVAAALPAVPEIGGGGEEPLPAGGCEAGRGRFVLGDGAGGEGAASRLLPGVVAPYGSSPVSRWEEPRPPAGASPATRSHRQASWGTASRRRRSGGFGQAASPRHAPGINSRAWSAGLAQRPPGTALLGVRSVWKEAQMDRQRLLEFGSRRLNSGSFSVY